MLASRLASGGQQHRVRTLPSSSPAYPNSQGLRLLNYIDDLEGMAASQQIAYNHFKWLQATLRTSGLVESKHKAPPSPLSVHGLVGDGV